MPRLKSKWRKKLSLKAKNDALFKIRSKRRTFVLNPLTAMVNLLVDKISLQQPEYEMERADVPDYYNCF